jgi:hypothetical protein
MSVVVVEHGDQHNAEIAAVFKADGYLHHSTPLLAISKRLLTCGRIAAVTMWILPLGLLQLLCVHEHTNWSVGEQKIKNFEN